MVDLQKIAAECSPDAFVTWDDLAGLADALAKLASINASERTTADLCEPLIMAVHRLGTQLVSGARSDEEEEEVRRGR